ncbi:MAG: hypothetical protein AAFX78_14555 [Cyanobacteria bacterium J06638_20]
MPILLDSREGGNDEGVDKYDLGSYGYKKHQKTHQLDATHRCEAA